MSAGFSPVDSSRSALMKRIRRAGTAPELAVATILRDLGVRYRTNVAGLPGTPDFANRRKGWAIFVHGCFWHGHRNCVLAKLPAHNREQWREKLRANRARDARKEAALARVGLRVWTVWQCELADEARLRRSLTKHLQRGSR